MPIKVHEEFGPAFDDSAGNDTRIYRVVVPKSSHLSDPVCRFVTGVSQQQSGFEFLREVFGAEVSLMTAKDQLSELRPTPGKTVTTNETKEKTND